jgi:hypothetical protein
MHPLRFQYELFSNVNPMMAPVGSMAKQVGRHRRPAAADNPFMAWQENISRQIIAGLDAWRDASEALAERTFLTVYGSPALQAAVGIDPASTRPLRKAERNLLHHELLRNRVAELRSRIPAGGLREAVIRGLLYAGMTRAAIDERGFEALRRIRQTHGELSLSAFKAWCASNSICCSSIRKPRLPPFPRCSHRMLRRSAQHLALSSRCLRHAAKCQRRTGTD